MIMVTQEEKPVMNIADNVTVEHGDESAGGNKRKARAVTMPAIAEKRVRKS